MATKFTPLHDRILIRRVEEAATTRGGILIPDSAKDKPQAVSYTHLYSSLGWASRNSSTAGCAKPPSRRTRIFTPGR